MTLADLIASRDHVLVDFDGPVCAVFGNLTSRTVADRLKVLLGPDLAQHVAASDDPFEVLGYASTVGPGTAAAVERQLRRLEAEAISAAPSTPGSTTAIRGLTAAGFTVTIVSNNGVDAIRTYLTLHDLASVVRGVSGRTNADPDTLKPDPFLLEQAMRSVGADAASCVMVGDSVSDIKAAHAAGTAVVAYANKPGKREQFEPLEPDFIIDDMTALLSGCAVPSAPDQT